MPLHYIPVSSGRTPIQKSKFVVRVLSSRFTKKTQIIYRSGRIRATDLQKDGVVKTSSFTEPSLLIEYPLQGSPRRFDASQFSCPSLNESAKIIARTRLFAFPGPGDE